MTRFTARRMVLAILIALCAASTVWAGFCPACSHRVFTKDIGACKLCGGFTSSGAFQLCMDCSDRLQECEACRKALPPAAPKLDEPARGLHKYGRWTYELSVSNEGSKSEGLHGKLSHAGRPLPEPARINDHVRSPWGLMYWAGNPAVPFGGHGWMLKPKPSHPMGQLLPLSRPVQVRVKVLAAERGAPPEEEWIRQMMKGMQIPQGVGSGNQWHTLTREPITIMGSKHFGEVYLALVDPGGEAPLRLEITGARPATVELPREPGTRRLIKHTSSDSDAALEFYFAVEVVPAAAQPGK
jgi:hypothetical protein